MEIPKQLRQKGIRFVLLAKGEKKPFHKNWTEKIIEFDNPELLTHISTGGNYGVMGGGKNLAIVDFDDENIQKQAMEKLPQTFTVKTGSGLLHLYYETDILPESFKGFDEEMTTIFDVQGKGKQVVGPGSLHPNGNRYEVIEPLEIQQIAYAELKAILMPFDKKPKKEIKKEESKRHEHIEDSFLDDLKRKVSIKDVLNWIGINTSINPTQCPFHHSEGGKCLGFQQEVCHCFHCEGSWNIFSLVMEEKKCSFKEALEILAKIGSMEKELEESRKRYLTFNIGKKEEKPIILNLEETDSLRQIIGRVYEEIKGFARMYCDMKEEYYDLLALWIIGTYIHSQFETYPYLFINAMRGSGKTRLLKIIKTIAHNGDLVTSLREAVLFRTAKDHTICIDEFEGVNKKENQGLRELLNACYKKGLKVKRMKRVRINGGEEQVVEEFEPYTPICMANIWGMEEVLGDRCIAIILEKSKDNRVIRLVEDFDNHPTTNYVKSTLNSNLVQLCSYFSVFDPMARWNFYINTYYQYTNTLTTLTTPTPLTTQEYSMFNKVWETGINGRDLELMFPLILIAKFISDELFEKFLMIAKDITKEKREEEMIESKDISLFEFVSKLSQMDDYYPVKTLTYEFRNYLGDDDEDDRWLNVKWLGRALRRLKLIIDKRRKANGIEVTLNISKAKETLLHLHKKE